MATALEVAKGISLVMSNKHDGATDGEGDPLEIGLRREKGLSLRDGRLIDGFNIQFAGDKLILKYDSEIHKKECHEKDFEEDVAQTIADVVSFVKKQYRKLTGNTLSLTPVEKKPHITVEDSSRIRSRVHAVQLFKVGGMDDVEPIGDVSKERLDKSMKDWISLGKGGKE